MANPGLPEPTPGDLPPLPPTPDEEPDIGPTGPRTPYPVNDPGIGEPGGPGSEPDVFRAPRPIPARGCSARRSVTAVRGAHVARRVEDLGEARHHVAGLFVGEP